MQIDNLLPLGTTVAPAGTQPATASGFGNLLVQALEQTASAQQEAGLAVNKFQAGESVPLHEVMLALQQSQISLQATVQARNRLVSAYHDIMNMQV